MKTLGAKTEWGGVVNAEIVYRRIEEGGEVQLIDVRTPGEFMSLHIPGSYNVPLDTLHEHRETLRRHCGGPLVLVCQSGQRARRAESALREIGMESLHVLDGGVLSWQAADLPLVLGPKRWPLERQVRLVAGLLVLTGALGGLLVTPWLTLLAAFVGAGLTFAAVTGWCGMALLLAKLPYNRGRGASCDIDRVVDALKERRSAAEALRSGSAVGSSA